MTSYSEARAAVIDKFVSPLVEFIEVTDLRMENAERRATEAEEAFDVLRDQRGLNEPDFVPRIALSQIWELLGVGHQTAAIDRLKGLLTLEKGE